MKYLFLLPYCLTRKGFDIYNILCEEFGKNNVIPASEQPNKYRDTAILGKVTLKLRTINDDFFFNDLICISEKYSENKIVLFPVEERFIQLIYSFIGQYGSRNFVYLLPDQSIFELSRDKKALNQYCYEKKISCPRFYKSSDVMALSFLEHPLIIKPRYGSGSQGIIFINNIEELIKLHDINLDDYVIQERLPDGRDVKGAFFLCKNGQVVASYTHQRVRTYPVDGGVTVYSRFDMNEKAIEAGARVLQELNWTGLAMVELLWDKRDESYKVIEINPRLWGSILLDQFSGAYLLRNYVELSLGCEPVRQDLRKDSEIRWLFPFELMNLVLAKGKISGFWRFGKETCLINITYSSFMRSFMFHLFYYLKAENYKKFLSKWLR